MVSDPHRNQPVVEYGRALESAKGAMVLVHGRGASAADILGLAEGLYRDDLAYLAPEAAGHTWYPNSFLAPIESNEPWLTSALSALGRVIERAVQAGIAPNKVMVVGFSQGACLSTEFVARNPTRYGGVIGFTGGLIGPPGTQFASSGDLAGTPVFLGAGDPDPHVPWSRVEESASVLRRLGAEVTLRRYPGAPHTIIRDEIEEARKMVRGVMESGAEE